MASLEFGIAVRYLRTRRRNGFISFIALIAILGIIIGVWALITVLSVMNGFENELKERILTVASHVTVQGNGFNPEETEKLTKELSAIAEVKALAPYSTTQAMLVKNQAVNGVLLRGIDPEQEMGVSTILSAIDKGSINDLQAGRFGIILGYRQALRLGVGIGSKLLVVAPRALATPVSLLPRSKQFTVVGIFRLNMHEYDSGLALIHWHDAAKLGNTRRPFDAIRLQLNDAFQAPMVATAIENRYPGYLQTSDWTRQHRNLFRALQIEKRVMFIILMMIIAVAAFNILATLVMTVVDKRADIAILRTLGMTPRRILRLFIYHGMLIAIIGVCIGATIGILTALNVSELVPAIEGLFDTEFFPADIYVISDFPAELAWMDVLAITVATILISLLATIYPAMRAAKTEPTKVLRNE